MPPLLRDGQRAGNDVDGRVAAAQPIALVHLERHAGGGIGERGPERIGAHRVAEQGRPALARAPGGELGEAPVLGQRAARDDGAERVEQHQPRGGERRGGEGLVADAGGGVREPIEVVGHDDASCLWEEHRLER